MIYSHTRFIVAVQQKERQECRGRLESNDLATIWDRVACHMRTSRHFAGSAQEVCQHFQECLEKLILFLIFLYLVSTFYIYHLHVLFIMLKHLVTYYTTVHNCTVKFLSVHNFTDQTISMQVLRAYK